MELAGIPDFDAAQAFYRDLLGWEIPEQENSAQLGGYRRAQLNGRDVAGASPVMQDGQPCEWNTYISVEDAEATTAKVREAGGTVIVEPMDVVGMGKMAIFTDPVGASFGIWEPGTFAGAELVNEDGAFAWNELETRDVAAARDFYTAVFDWTVSESDMGGTTYYAWMRGDAPVGGMTDISGRVPDEVPSHWLVYFNVPDVDAAVAAAEANGGGVTVGPIDLDMGRFAVLQDQFGAAFAAIAPTKEARRAAP
jgi:predicted enzyme related to lactoylglutathione lyase